MIEEYEDQELIETLDELVSNGEIEDIKEAFVEYPPAHIVDFLLTKQNTEVVSILNILESDNAGHVFSYFNKEKQYELSKIIGRKVFSDIFTAMYSDSRADLFQEMTKEEQIQLLPFLDKKTREDVIVLSAYPPETAGGIMSTDFATILENMTCQQAIAKIRKDAPSQKMIYYVYVVSTINH